ncbi:MAG: hypothetical protein IJI20_02695 [Firmicutes bacterium]|nr:hypothetical protein [Bacillota bacterium]
MKKIVLLALTLSLFVMIPLAGCGSDNTADIRAAAEGFMNAMQEGDIEGMKAYSDPSLYEEDGDLAAFAQIENIDESFAEAVGVSVDDLSDKTKAEIQGFTDNLMDKLVTSYEITDVTEDADGKGRVALNTTFGFDPDKVDDIDMDDETEKMVTEYTEKNSAELMQIYQNGGEQAMMNKILDDLMGDILQKYTDAIMATGEVSQESVMLLENKDGKWLVVSEEPTDAPEDADEGGSED